MFRKYVIWVQENRRCLLLDEICHFTSIVFKSRGRSRYRKELTKLIIANKKKNEKWEIKEIDEANNNVIPVIWTEPPGEFIDKSNGEKISTKYQAILFVRYEAWAILYYWDENEIKKAWLSD